MADNVFSVPPVQQGSMHGRMAYLIRLMHAQGESEFTGELWHAAHDLALLVMESPDIAFNLGPGAAVVPAGKRRTKRGQPRPDLAPDLIANRKD